MTILKMLQRLLDMPQLTIDQLIHTLQDNLFAKIEGAGYIPMFTRNELTDRLQELAGVNISTQIIPTCTMTAAYRSVKV